ncbi:MAG: TetR/AcrR family transcriptional regulator, partial [Pseudomonadota bacterium]
GIERGEFREALALELPEVVMGPTYMAAVWKMIFDDRKPLDLERFIDVHLDLVLNGLRVR